MRVVLFTVESPDTICGKNTSLERIRHGLSQIGVDARSISSFGKTEEELRREFQEYEPEIIHAFNASRAGATASRLAESLDIPFVLTITGTDLNVDVFDDAKRQNVIANLNKSAHLICANLDTTEKIADLGVSTLATVVPKGVHFPNTSLQTDRFKEGFEEGDILFLLPANFRKVKNPIFAVEPLARLRNEGLPVHLLFLGHVIEDSCYAELVDVCRGRDWIHFPGERPRDEMYSWYRMSDVILNTSFSEGGSNVILEAMAAERCVLASDVEGNRAFVTGDEPNPTGLLYHVSSEPEEPMLRLHDVEDLFSKAEVLARDASLRKQIGANALAAVKKSHPPEAEAEAHLRVYEKSMSSYRFV
ncbi:MAG: glycosyltransferase [Planctomycetota bacterium]|nr:glycosyltransferase [Planctomycetota bacterium]